MTQHIERHVLQQWLDTRQPTVTYFSVVLKFGGNVTDARSVSSHIRP